MAATHPNLTENPIKLREFRKNNKNPRKINGISLWAFLLSILIYISIFYIFNLSPLNLLNSTKFWFFMSNTLILIIAADFGAFFSSAESNNFYQDYLKTPPSFEYYTQRPNFKKIQENVIFAETAPVEEIKCVVVPSEIVTKNDSEIVPQENSPFVTECHEIVPKNDLFDCSVQTKFHHHSVTKQECQPNITTSRQKCSVANPELSYCEKDELNNVREVNDNLRVRSQNPGDDERAKCARSNSEASILFADNDEEKKNGLQRSQSERYNNLKNVEENNEFSEMSVEELNRRVEEFIQRFNRQIRLQAASRKFQN